MDSKLKSAAFVTVQLLALGYLAVTGPLLAKQPLWMCVEIVSLLLMMWAISVFRLRQLRIAPGVAADGRLVTSGPYRFVRHPMYTSVLLLTTAWVMNSFSVDRLVVWFALLLDLLGKLYYEEALLAEKFSQYTEYRRRTKRLIPFLF